MSDRTPKRQLTDVESGLLMRADERLRDAVPEGGAIRIELVKWPEGLRGRFKGSDLVAELEAEHRQLRS